MALAGAGLPAASAPPASADPARAAPARCGPGPFTAQLDDDLRRRWPGNRFTAAVVDLESGCQWSYRPELRITTASVFKIEVMAGVLLRAQAERRGLTDREHSLVHPMITESANSPTSRLYGELGGSSGFARLNRLFGLTETEAAPNTWGLTRTSARDQVSLVRQVLVEGGPLRAESKATAWRYMGSVVPSQRWGVGERLPAGFRFGLKNGFAPSRCCGWRINTAGAVLDARGGGWVMAILTDGWPSEGAGRRAMSFIAGAVNEAMVRVPLPDIVAIRRTGTPAVEAHALSGPDTYLNFAAHRSIPLDPADAQAWSFLTADHDGDGLLDLVGIQHDGASATTEIHVLSGSSGWQEWSLHAPTALQPTDPAAWSFALADHDADGVLDLYAVSRRGDTGTEVHVVDGTSGFSRFSSHEATALGPTTAGGWELLVGDVDGDGFQDLAAVKRQGERGVELHVLSGSAGFDVFSTHAATPLPSSDPSRWSYRLVQSHRAGPLDLLAVDGDGETGTEVHVVAGAGGWSRFVLQTPTALHATTSPEWEFA